MVARALARCSIGGVWVVLRVRVSRKGGGSVAGACVCVCACVRVALCGPAKPAVKEMFVVKFAIWEILG